LSRPGTVTYVCDSRGDGRHKVDIDSGKSNPKSTGVPVKASMSDVYMTILLPTAVGKAETHVPFRKTAVAYRQNRGLDMNKDGQITKGEAAAKVQAKLVKGLGKSLRG
jgi:hypothetical protein